MSLAPVGIAWRVWGLFALALLTAGCHTANERAGTAATGSPTNAADSLEMARSWSHRADMAKAGANALDAWGHCAIAAYPALATAGSVAEAAALSTRCTDALLAQVLAQHPKGWTQGPMRIGSHTFDVEFRHLPAYLEGPLTLTRAQDVAMSLYDGVRMQRAGFGVPLALLAPRCNDRPLCELLPPEGVFRSGTAWIEPGADATALPRLVIADAVALDALVVGSQRLPLAYDTSAAYAEGVRRSSLDRLAIWGLLGGDEVGRRSGVYLLEDYDPNKRPLIMIHGLGSSPLTWARLSNAVWGAPDLRARFQVWHVVYQTDAPLLVTRRRVQEYMDEAWRILDPDGNDPARAGVVLVGHSMGGVVSRMLCIDSGEVLWNAAFLSPLSAMAGDPADIQGVSDIFHFKPYPGVSRAIFIAAPHRGSPSAMQWFGRLARVLVGRRTPELQALKRVAEANPDAVQPELRLFYQQARINSISTLQVEQPVRVAGQALMPAAGIAFHTIAGALPGRSPPSDGVVPLESAVLAGAASTLVVASGHNVHESPEGIAEVLRILRESLAEDHRANLPVGRNVPVSPPSR